MTKYCDYTEWDSTRERRENEPAKSETTDPFDDSELQRRVGELIARAAAGPKKSES
jgi:hypothetical protein